MAWISHQSPTATADMPISLSCTLCGLVDVVFATLFLPSVRAAQIYGYLSGLATPPGKNSRPKGLPLGSIKYAMKNSTPQAVQACHELLLWLIPHLDKFPRVRRFTLGERLESTLIDVLELLVEAAFSRAKQDALKRANFRLEVARHLWRLAYELQVIPTRRYEHGARLMDDLGRQVGGWLRAL
jgi:hypothetical protein